MLKPAAVSMRAATLQCYHTCASKLTLLAVQAAAMATEGPMAYIWAANLWHPRKCSEFSSQLPQNWLRQRLDHFTKLQRDKQGCCKGLVRSTGHR